MTISPDAVSTYIDRVVASLSDGLSSFDQLKRREIRVISSDGNTVVRSWPSSSCLFGEMNYNGSHYCLNSGKWYRIDNDYAAGINAAYDRVPISVIDFPEWDAEMKESDYNKLLAKQDGDGKKSRALMDANNIPYGGGASKIELCDVLFEDGTFVHVKKYSGSAVLSHLFNQGLVSARLVKSDEQF
ncbi:MAG: TIGR04141 family sporadically distributed protein [Bacteroidales bacterium]|nr:TIGR04141 family sporadically distributed protein [Bacteroidales bacterium]